MDKLHLLVSYFKYFFTAKGPDRVHSPFVFNLYYYHLKNRNTFYVFPKIECFFKRLEKDKRTLEASDLGAGTKHHGSHRVIGKLVKTSSIPAKWGEVLFKISNLVKPKDALELGTAFGKSTAYIQSGYQKMHLTSLEGDTGIYKEADYNIRSLRLKNINLVNTDIYKFLVDLKTTQQFDYVFFDANHTYKATTQYFNALLSHLAPKAVLVFDDIYWSKEMTRAWKEICGHHRNTVCIDLFRMGIIFMDRDQEKEYFKLRL